MDSREASLWVQIYGEHAISIKGKILCQVSCGGRLGAATFEVDATDDLQVFALTAMLNVVAAGLIGAIQVKAQSIDVFDRVQPATIREDFDLRPLPLQRELPQVAICNTDHLRDFARCKLAKPLLDARMILLHTLCMKLCGEIA